MNAILKYGQAVSDIIANGERVNLVFPTLPAKLTEQTRQAIPSAIEMLKGNITNNVAHALNGSLSKFCFVRLQQRDGLDLIKFVAELRARCHPTYDATDVASYAGSPSTEAINYLVGLRSIKFWYRDSLRREGGYRKNELAIIGSPSLQRWICETYEDSRTLETVFGDPHLRNRYLQQCSIAWLEDVLARPVVY